METNRLESYHPEVYKELHDRAVFLQIVLDRVEIKTAHNMELLGAEIEVSEDQERHTEMVKELLDMIQVDYDEFLKNKSNRFTGIHSESLFQK